MYRVLRYFTDLTDDNTAYHTGDAFPREGVTVPAERIEELSGKNNKRGIPLIEKVGDKEESAPEDKKPRKARKKG